MAAILDFFAETHSPCLHARGEAATVLLLNALAPQDGQRILEIGFGTGQTLTEIATNWPGTQLFGVEKSPKMLAVAQRRLRFCGLKKIELKLLSEESLLPYPTGFFDSVYCESVLAIMPFEIIENLVAEVFRVLKPGGTFVFNESIWRNGTPPETISAINRECLERFGIPQSSEQFPYTQDWIKLCESEGFQKLAAIHLEEMPTSMPTLPPILQPGVLAKSKLFSVVGALKSRFYPSLRRQRREWRTHEKHFGKYGFFLEGVLFVMRKPEIYSRFFSIKTNNSSR
jgi:ubiquinone/menaquinone biosynthesis C-methylase UbiE